MTESKKEKPSRKTKAKAEMEEESTGFNFDQALQAITALQEHANQKATNAAEDGTPKLFSDDRAMYIDIVMKKYPIHIPAVKFIRICLPHPFHDPQTATSCILVRDLDKYPRRLQDREKSQRIYKQFFDEMQNLTEFTQVLSVSQLVTEYKTYESRRKLCHSYDVLIADKRLEGQITKILGKEFIRTRKVPFLIDVTKQVRRSFQHVFELTRATLTPSTLKFKVKIGRSNQPADHLAENLKTVVTRLASRIPGKWANVRSAYVSIPAFYDLPVYVDWGPSNDIKFPKTVKTKRHFVEDELTTLQSRNDDDEETPKVRVFDDGMVRIAKRRKVDNKVKKVMKDEQEA